MRKTFYEEFGKGEWPSLSSCYRLILLTILIYKFFCRNVKCAISKYLLAAYNTVYSILSVCAYAEKT